MSEAFPHGEHEKLCDGDTLASYLACAIEELHVRFSDGRCRPKVF